MKTFLSRILAAILVTLSASFMTTGCGPKEEPEIAVTGVSLSQNSVTLEIGGTTNLTATVNPSNATNKAVSWSSSNQSVATVNNGTVTAVAEGTATITATAGGKSASCPVTVNKKVVAVTSVVLDKAEVELETGGTVTLTTSVKPDDATDKTVSWTTSDAKIATVENGTVTAVAEGTATITAKSADKEATCKVTVKNKVIEVESIELDKSEAEVETGETLTLTATVKPDDATDKTVTWSTSDARIATVEDGKVTAIAEGTVIITVKAGDKTAECPVTILPGTLDKARRIMEKVYEAWGARDWDNPWIPGENWPGLEYDPYKDKVGLLFKKMGIKGEIPECIGELGDLIWFFSLNNEPGVTGSIPESFANFVALEQFGLSNTSITFIPDIFAGMPLTSVSIQLNDKLFCPLPYSIGDSPELKTLLLHYNRFTGEIPASWARLGDKLTFYNNCLSGTLPKVYLEPSYFDKYQLKVFWQKDGYGFDMTDVDYPGYWNYDASIWPQKVVKDLNGKTFSMDDVIKKNKYTVYMVWAPWCPFSKDLMPQLRDYYAKYHKDGLEVVATVQMTSDFNQWNDLAGQVKEVEEKGYGQWYNFYWDPELYSSYLMATPHAEVYDSEGFVQFSSVVGYPDPVRKRFGKTASFDLIPFLETLFGPAEEASDYVSTDYSKNGEVSILQKASVGKGINIVFMGDGYTDKDMAPGGLYETLMKQSMEEFFAIEPYKTFRKRFNVYAVKVVSKNGWIGEGFTTALETRFAGGAAVRGNDDKCYEYAMKVPGVTTKDNLLVCVMLNTKKHVGTAASSQSLQSSVAYTSTYGNDPALFGSTLRHEAGGHGFAFLADEYINSQTMAPADHIAFYNEVYNKYGWYSNVDFTDDPAKIRWSAFLNDDRYKDEVGIFKGGALYGEGVWRPTENSMMNMNFEYFNAPSRWAIYKRIMELSGETASFEKFLEYDAVNRGKKQSSPPRTRSIVEWVPDAPPVILP